MSTTIIAALLAAAGGFHLAALPGHLHESAGSATFFAIVALGQLAGAVLVATRPSRRTTVGVILGNAVVLAIWAVSRTTGLPVEGELGVREPMAVLDGLAAIAEVLVVAGTLRVLRRSGMIRLRSAGWQPVVFMAGVWLASGGVATGLVDPSHHHGAQPSPAVEQGGGHSHSAEDQHAH